MKAKKAMPAAKKSPAKRGAKKTLATGKPVQGAASGVAEYVAGIPESSRKTFDALRQAVRQAAPKGAQEVRSYGIVALKAEKVLVWYAAFAQHCSLFPTASVLAQFRDELKGYKVSKGTVQFSLEKPLPAALVKKLVRARVAEALGKKK
jgi:uncharacterized protein YdhG (YjbR/CyaY superfamily)